MNLYDDRTQRRFKRWTLLIGSALAVGYALGKLAAGLI